ncbi:unnamed protein product [Arctia plantaginis]|uniref:Reverse transcriptase/retrotransposon-derived protein RNase H-like domain-containing protein n=1 Tax=Arctia plantaginis TaxID=874455 RepID=A0A8S1ASU9_ARCPL|nr:unnamed protein product [Arctia plantaginis]
MPKPQSVKDLERFLGLVTYVGNFIPKLSDKTRPLRELLQKDIEWHWTEIHDSAFSELKRCLTKKPVLQFYSMNDPITISVDASKSGLGAVSNNIDNDLQSDITEAIRSLTVKNELTDSHFIALQKETELDKDLQKLKQYVVKGWPFDKYRVELNIKPYWNYRHELSEACGLLWRGLIKRKLIRRQQVYKQYYDRNAKKLAALSVGQPVKIKDLNNNKWISGTITKQLRERSYEIKLSSGNIIVRNRRHMIADSLQKHRKTNVNSYDSYADYDDVCPTETHRSLNSAPGVDTSVPCNNGINADGDRYYVNRFGRTVRPPDRWGY